MGLKGVDDEQIEDVAGGQEEIADAPARGRRNKKEKADASAYF